MNIQHYSFGEIVVDGKIYNHDIVICGKTVSPWLRDDTNVVKEKDISFVFDENPDTFIIGTGSDGSLKVPEKCKDDMDARKIELFIVSTDEAIDIFEDKCSQGKKVIVALNLT